MTLGAAVRAAPHPPSHDAAGAGCGRARTVPGRLDGRVLLVDGSAVCEACGVPVVRVGRDAWRHVPPGSRGPRSRWSTPVRPGDLAAIGSFDAFVRRHPWVTADAPGDPPPVTAGDWAEARRRALRADALEAAFASRSTVRRELVRGGDPYAAIVGALLGLDDDPGARRSTALTATGRWRSDPGVLRLLALPGRRRALVAAYAWAIPSSDALDVLATLGPLLEAGAGAGYWAARLRARGVDVVATDLRPPGRGAATAFHAARAPWSDVATMPATDAVARHPGRTLLLCWPPFDDDAASLAPLRAFRGDRIAYVGELGGATGSARFHRELVAGWAPVETVALPSWPGLRDRLHVFERSPRRRRVAPDRCPACGRFAALGALGRCDGCVARRPAALAIRSGSHRVEYAAEQLAGLPAGVVTALRRSPDRVA